MAKIIATLAQNPFCIGCGLCAAICPQEAIEMAWNRHGEYSPIEATPCSKECGLCQEVCPFADSGENEDTIGERLYGAVAGIRHHPETGYYLATYVGYSKKHRLTSASGGMASWLLEALLSEGVVDHVICVAPTGEPERLFAFRVFNTAEDVRTGSGSAYYPVEMSEVIRQVLATPGQYAITGLPCFIKAIRLAQQKNKKLRERVVVTVGLVCGQLKSKHFTDYIAAFAGVQGKITGVRYRGKSPTQPASNYHYAFTTEDGQVRKISWKEGISEAWMNRWFTPNACNYCDDVFAECADVTCMDAWLPEYSQDHRGMSLVLVRSPQVQEAIAHGEDVSLDPIPIGKVVESQRGVITVKRQHLAYRLYLDKKHGQKVPKKRVTVVPGISRNPFLRREVVLRDRMLAESRNAWAEGVRDAKSLRDVMQPDMRKLARNRQLANTIIFPIRTLVHIRKIARRRPL